MRAWGDRTALVRKTGKEESAVRIVRAGLR